MTRLGIHICISSTANGILNECFSSTGDELLDRLYGAFVVKQSKRREPHVTIYDHDDVSHVLLVEYAISKNGINEMHINGNEQSNTVNTAVFFLFFSLYL